MANESNPQFEGIRDKLALDANESKFFFVYW